MSPLTPEQYQKWYQQSLENPEAFWAEQAENFIDWTKPWHKVMQSDFKQGIIQWFEGAELNVCYNCIDRHLPQRANQTALIWEGDDATQTKTYTYQELYNEVCQAANALQSLGVKSGTKVCLYMPMIPEAMIVMLACARMGAVHSVVFGGFSPKSLAERIQDADCEVVITADEGIRGGKIIPLKHNVDEAVKNCPSVTAILVVKRTGNQIPWNTKKDYWYHDLIAAQPKHFKPESFSAEAPLFILYTSGSTGKPKGVLHTSGGYLLYAAMTFRYVFDYQEQEIFWCTADVGWVTGHSYVVYGPLANGATVLMFEGVPTYPDPSRFWQVVDKHQVNIFYTAPTAIRALIAKGNEWVHKTSRKSLRILATVGEPINPEAWRWYYKVVGEERCPIVDTWWQTETGGIMIASIPNISHQQPGAAAVPFFGVKPIIMGETHKAIEGEGQGELLIEGSWPGQMRTLYNNHPRFLEAYFSQYPGYYFTGDGAKRDKLGEYWITGRVDDVINVSGHRIGTAEVESALVSHAKVAEAAVVGIPHEVKGQGLYAYVTLKSEVEPSESIQQELIEQIKIEIGKFAVPEHIQWAPTLPKTRSGKIMRRILQKIASGEQDKIGDTSTLADPEVIDSLVKGR